MATKDKILTVLSAQSSSVTLKQLSDILGEPQGNFFTQLDRMSKANPPLVTKDEEKKWLITDEGRASLEQTADEEEKPPPEVLKASEDPIPVISEYQKFMQLGRQSGVSNQGLLKAVCDHVWAQDYHNLEVVHAALIQANIQPDVASRWVAFWSSFLKQTVTPELENTMRSAKTGRDGVVQEGKSFRAELTHILDPDTDIPIYVGEGMGSMTSKDAIELAKIRAAAKVRGAAVAGAGGAQNASPTDPYAIALKIMEMVKEKRDEEGGTPPAKSYLLKVNPDGSSQLEEIDPSKPTIVQTGAAPTPAGAAGTAGLTGQVDQITALVNALVNLGIVVKPSQNSGVPQQKIIYLDKDGKPIEAPPGQPVIIYRDAPAAQNPMAGVPITLQGADGKPVTVQYGQLETFFRIEEWKDKRRREEDKHSGHMELVSTAKDLLKKGAAALQDIATSKEGGT